MSWEEIQKINKLAQEMRSKGLVSSNEEAAKQAGQIITKNSQTQEVKMESSNDYIFYRSLIEKNKEQMQKELDKFREALAVIARDLDAVKSELRSLKGNAPQEAKPVEETPKEDKPVGKIYRESPKQNTSSNNPRVGNTNSQDVCIEKMFYCGRK